MSGIRLEELDTEEMLDVIHFLMEEDLASYSMEHMQAKDSTRTTLYKNLYNTEYKYKMQKTSKNAGGDNWDIPQEFMVDEDSSVVKPYVPPTDFNPDSFLPFGSDIDAPLM